MYDCGRKIERLWTQKEAEIVKGIFPDDPLKLENPAVWFGDAIQFVLLSCLLNGLKANEGNVKLQFYKMSKHKAAAAHGLQRGNSSSALLAVYSYTPNNMNRGVKSKKND